MVLNTKSQFTSLLMKWHEEHARELPWKSDRDPYKIWLSEIILQQTRVEQGLPYYLKILEQFPNLDALANADEDELMQLWQGLGYYSRARNLLFTAKYIQSELRGKFPNNYSDLLKLKGIGPYTAAAISSFAFDEVRAVIDGNVIRVLSRIFGIEIPFDSSKGKKVFEQLASELISQDDPATYNQAIMDFGATQCLPKKPNCISCTFRSTCKAYVQNQVIEFPVRSKKVLKKDRYFYYYVLITPENEVLIRKRSADDIWKGLYEFPLMECNEEEFSRSKHAVYPDFFNKLYIDKIDKTNATFQYKQVLTHRIIHAKFITIRTSFKDKSFPENNYLVDYENLCNFAFPKLIDWFIEEKLISL